jgi:acyl carrier protein
MLNPRNHAIVPAEIALRQTRQPAMTSTTNTPEQREHRSRFIRRAGKIIAVGSLLFLAPPLIVAVAVFVDAVPLLAIPFFWAAWAAAVLRVFCWSARKIGIVSFIVFLFATLATVEPAIAEVLALATIAVIALPVLAAVFTATALRLLHRHGRIAKIAPVIVFFGLLFGEASLVAVDYVSEKPPASVPAQDIAARVKSIVVDKMGIKDARQVTEGASFVADLGADDLDLIKITMALEEEFGCEIPDDEAKRLVTVGDAIRYVEKKGAK